MIASIFYSFLTFLSIAQAPADATATVPAHLTPTIETSVDRNEILIGDVFHLNVAITHDPSVRILQRETGVDLGQFEIKEINPGQEEKLPDGNVREIIDYQLSTFFTGEFEIPAFDIVFQISDGASGSIRTSPIKITVRSLTPEEMEGLDIREIKEPVVISGPSRMWIVWTVLGSLIALGFVGYGIWRHFHNRKSPVPIEPPLPPHELAYQALRALREETEWREKRDYEYFSTRISEIIRVYIEQRWRIAALDETTEETLSELAARGLSTEVYQKFSFFFSDCDLMKFARHELPPEDLNGLIERAVSIVDDTRETFVENTEISKEPLRPDENSKEPQPVCEA